MDNGAYYLWQAPCADIEVSFETAPAAVSHLQVIAGSSFEPLEASIH